eukprot:960634-Rhodomonas_salina.6
MNVASTIQKCPRTLAPGSARPYQNAPDFKTRHAQHTLSLAASVPHNLLVPGSLLPRIASRSAGSTGRVSTRSPLSAPAVLCPYTLVTYATGTRCPMQVPAVLCKYQIPHHDISTSYPTTVPDPPCQYHKTRRQRAVHLRVRHGIATRMHDEARHVKFLESEAGRNQRTHKKPQVQYSVHRGKRGVSCT